MSAGQASEETHQSFASADAARVGGGMYSFVLEALCTLATDPTKMVSKRGQAALKSAGVQMQPLATRPGTRLRSETVIQNQWNVKLSGVVASSTSRTMTHNEALLYEVRHAVF